LLSVGVNAILIPPDLLRVFMPKGFFADHLDNSQRNGGDFSPPFVYYRVPFGNGSPVFMV